MRQAQLKREKENETMTTYTVTIWGETVQMAADFAQASCPIQFLDEDGNWIGTGKQVADFQHRPEVAMRDALEADAKMSGDDPEENDDVADEIEAAIEAMTEIDA
jgi:hypothetical protein